MDQTPPNQRMRDARRIWNLATPYFRSDEKWQARGLLAAIVALNLAAVYMLVQLNEWNRVFYDALQNKDQPVFWEQLLRFTYIAFAYIVISVYRFYLTQLLELRWRGWLTKRYLGRWLTESTFYRMELARFSSHAQTAPDNPDQRIQEDLNLFTTYTVTLSMGVLNATVTLFSFVGILWGLSGSFAFEWGGASYEIPGFMVWMAVLYAVAGSVVTHFVGRPQIPLNFQQQRLEADFRHHLVRVREYSEAIALDRGEKVEQSQLGLRFSSVLGNYLQLIRKQKNLIWFTNFFGQAAVVFPFVVAAPRFFSGAIQLGQLMQIASAFGRVQDSLSWFVDNYQSLAAWRATADRLTSFEAALASAEHARSSLQVTQAQDMTLRSAGLSLGLPNGAQLLSDSNVELAPGDRVLLQGASGSGKSTLLRALAGIWPFAAGRIARPERFSDDAMFLPQRPYLPQGRLRDALAYPEPSTRYTDAEHHAALEAAQLSQLQPRLDDEDAWTQKLSGGEQQRLAMARVFLKKPRWVFADEAVSALDEPNGNAVYTRLLHHLAQVNGALLSIAHGPALAALHNRAWRIERDSTGSAAPYALRT